MATKKQLDAAKEARALAKAEGKVAAMSAGSLMEAIDSMASKAGIKESRTYRPVPTGLNVLDFYNARYFTNHETKEYELFTGMPVGKLIMKIGYTGAGKTTLAVQESIALIEPFAEGSIFHFDLENAWSIERTADISGGKTIEWVKERYRRFDPCSLNKIYAFIKRVINIKQARMANPNDSIWVIDPRTGERMPSPTIILVDTVAALQSDEVLTENEEMGKLMFEKGAQAGANNAFAQRLAGMIGDPNITIIAINHVRVGMSDGAPKAKRIQYLNVDETCPGGTGFPQYSDYFLKMVPSESLTAKGDTEMAIPGKVVRCTIVKSRLSYDGRTFELVLTDNGFSNAWSNYLFLKSAKCVKGGGSSFYIEGADGTISKKFAQRHFAGLYDGDAEFRAIVDSRLEQELLALVPQPGSAQELELQAGAEEVEFDPETDIDGDVTVLPE